MWLKQHLMILVQPKTLPLWHPETEGEGEGIPVHHKVVWWNGDVQAIS